MVLKQLILAAIIGTGVALFYSVIFTYINQQVIMDLKEDINYVQHVFESYLNAIKIAESSDKLENHLTSLIEKHIDDIKGSLTIPECRRRLTADITTEQRDFCETKINYASASKGAKIYDVTSPKLDALNCVQRLFHQGFNLNPPSKMLKNAGDLLPGECFAFAGQEADVTIKLADEIYVGGVEIEHLPAYLSPSGSTSSAPKAFAVFGLDTETLKQETFLGEFVYENSMKNLAQYFKLKFIGKFRYVRFKFQTNHGHPEYTCIYKIAVYDA